MLYNRTKEDVHTNIYLYLSCLSRYMYQMSADVSGSLTDLKKIEATRGGVKQHRLAVAAVLPFCYPPRHSSSCRHRTVGCFGRGGFRQSTLVWQPMTRALGLLWTTRHARRHSKGSCNIALSATECYSTHNNSEPHCFLYHLPMDRRQQ